MNLSLECVACPYAIKVQDYEQKDDAAEAQRQLDAHQMEAHGITVHEGPNWDGCTEVSDGGLRCWLTWAHPGRVHVDISDGGLRVWSKPDTAPFRNRPTVPADPLQDAPDALRDCYGDGDPSWRVCSGCGSSVPCLLCPEGTLSVGAQRAREAEEGQPAPVAIDTVDGRRRYL